MKPRILLIEDNEDRRILFRRWLAGSEFHLIEAHSAGQALGLLRRCGAETITGVCLDHDLGDAHASGTQVAIALQNSVRRSTPILVHSMNVTRAPWMVSTLRRAGFTVTRVRFAVLDAEGFESWIGSVRDSLDT